MYDNWEQLEADNKQCKKCRLCQTRNNVVFGTGNKEADLLFIGEGPGADEDLQGEPFVGKAGKLMNMAFDVVGLKREEVYIANIVKCRPPSNRNPEDDEAGACLNYLRNQVILVKPKIIVLLGSIALKNILGLTCDPVGGLVEIPCVKRNAFLAVHAITSAELVLANIESKIPPDEVVDAMVQTGQLMSPLLKETSMGGLATTKTGNNINKNLEKLYSK